MGSNLAKKQLKDGFSKVSGRIFALVTTALRA